jgi:hypothetical protein
MPWGSTDLINTSYQELENPTKAKWWVRIFGTGNISIVVHCSTPFSTPVTASVTCSTEQGTHPPMANANHGLNNSCWLLLLSAVCLSLKEWEWLHEWNGLPFEAQFCPFEVHLLPSLN